MSMRLGFGIPPAMEEEVPRGALYKTAIIGAIGSAVAVAVGGLIYHNNPCTSQIAGEVMNYGLKGLLVSEVLALANIVLCPRSHGSSDLSNKVR